MVHVDSFETIRWYYLRHADFVRLKMDAAFKRAANPRTFKVLGLTLKPLTLGHRFLLAKYDSAFVTEEKAQIEDLMLSVFVCAQPWRNAERNVLKWWFPSFIWLWSQFLRKTILPIEYNKFRLYWDEGHACPKIKKAFSEYRDNSTPDECRLLAMLMADFHMTRADALDTTLAEANALWASQGDRQDAIELESNDRIEALKAFARAQDEAKGLRRN